jgi:hypothetical protein
MANTASFQNLVAAFGGFHDSRIVSLDWSRHEKVMIIDMDKIYANFSGLAKKSMQETARFIFHDAELTSFHISGLENYRVFDCDLGFSEDRHTLKINLSPAGRLEISYSDVSYPEIDLPVMLDR